MLVCRIRVTGSAAVNMCLVASGQADAYYEYGVHCWDIAAGDILVREAGGVCMMPTGKTSAVAGGHYLHSLLCR